MNQPPWAAPTTPGVNGYRGGKRDEVEGLGQGTNLEVAQKE
jgi:hypothetical protein